MPSGSDKWKHFERLVAAIHKAADQGAEVKWNEKINGRQFDVTIRFKKGLYDYLTVVECKDYGTPVPVSDVEAFVIKAEDVNANYKVMASTSGFQSGTQRVAEKHNMTLIQVTESPDIDLALFGAHLGDEIDALSIGTITLEYTDGEKKALPKQSNAMTYYVNKIMLQDPSRTRSLDSVLAELSGWFARGAPDEYKNNVVDCPSDTRVIGPDDGEVPLKPLLRIHVRTALTKARVITGPYMFDPYLLVPDVKVKNVATGEEKIFSQHDLALGVNTVFEEGRFYEQVQLGNYYYCDRIEGNRAGMYLVESFQLGELFQAEFTQETQYAKLYVPVTDKLVIQRLQRRLEQFRATQAQS